MSLSVTTWNVSGINNNPFEFYTDLGNPNLTAAFNEIAKKAMQCIEGITEESNTEPKTPKTVKDVFTEGLYQKLLDEVKKIKDKDGAILFEEGSPELTAMTDFWSEVCDKEISEFFKHTLVKEYRLFSWPDRYINIAEDEKRPTVINTSSFDDINNLENWWTKWKTFMFEKQFSKGEGATRLLPPNKYLKNPKGEIPLQVLALALYDSTLYYVLESTGTNWKEIRAQICASGMVKPDKKTEKGKDILKNIAADIVFLQEVGEKYAEEDKWQTLGQHNYRYAGPTREEERGAQNSLILLKESRFDDCQTITDEVLNTASDKLKDQYKKSELTVAIGVDKEAKGYFLASVHTDSKGETSLEVIQLLIQYAKDNYTAYPLIIGIDANTGKTKAAEAFISALGESCETIYSTTELSEHYTTKKQRTYLQPQLNEKKLKLDKSLKDYIVFTSRDFTFENRSRVIADTVNPNKSSLGGKNLPTPDFPSDHCLVKVDLSPKS